MNKKLSICLIVGIIAVALVSYGITKVNDLQPVSFGLGGGSHGVTINAELPEAPETMPYYRVVGEDYDKPSLHELRRELRQKPQKRPSREEAVRIAEEYIESHGGMPDDAVFGGVSTVYSTHYRGGEIVEKKPEHIHAGYHRVFNGMPMVGAGDGMGVVIGDNGTILSFRKSWRELEYAGEREIVTASEAVERLRRGETVHGTTVQIGTKIDSVALGYYSAMPRVKQEFYEPVWIFCGRCRGRNVPALPVWAGAVMPTPTPFRLEPTFPMTDFQFLMISK